MVGCLCPIIRPQQVAAAALLLWARQPGDTDCCMADAQQQLRAVSHCRLTQEAEHRLVSIFVQ